MGSYDHHKTRKLIRRLAQEIKEQAMANADRLDAALTGIAGDITGLKAAYQALVDAQATEVEAAVTAARAGFEASLDSLVARAESIDSETPPVVPDQDPLPEG